MISSTRADLMQYREATSAVIKKVAARHVRQIQLVEKSMEQETQSGDREFAVGISKRWVEDSDWLVLIVGWNYGTISHEPGANELSVTEYEYRHAILHKKAIFVFIAGEPGSQMQYRYSPTEEVDLKDYRGDKQSDAERRKLADFKSELTSHVVAFFRNLDDFAKQLEDTLEKATQDEATTRLRASQLPDLIVAVSKPIAMCSTQVRLLADCKVIHDLLHELRYKVIRRLREELLPRWPKEGRLDGPTDAFLSARWAEAMELKGCIRGRGAALAGTMKDLLRRAKRGATAGHDPFLTDAKEDLLRNVDALLSLPPWWEADAEHKPNLEDFSETLAVFSGATNAAFVDADSAMLADERVLDVLHADLLQNISAAREQLRLGPADERMLSEELASLGEHKAQLAAALKSHHDWQDVQNAVDLLDAWSEEARQFRRALDQFRRNHHAKLRRLVEYELRNTGGGDSSVTEITEAMLPGQGAVARRSDPAVLGSKEENELRENVQQLKVAMDDLENKQDVEVFPEMRKRLDAAFYRIDKRTLAVVERSRERVEAFDDLLARLQATPRPAA